METERAGDLVASLFGPKAMRRLSDAQRAARAWYAANGDRERSHTTGVWLRKPGRAKADPVLVVRLDSNLLAQELATNKDLYLARLARAGVQVSDLRFTVGQGRQAPAADRARARHDERPQARELTAAERRRVEEATRDLPDSLRESVARAMRATMARPRKKSGT